ncbi:MAG: CDP-diacylglycerol--glycerol-3-phosphate 3-phosphatidyltransferase [Bombilactobacillus mellifer]|uniref:CDP-diacylglycerol--glycerol-3-phosphate 3-phosphatidyltransferase n=1 Tax=Bombilactobacillus mellifer TaxID=1218492 RepID=UPI0023F525B8|nr:CDP-diacylglycerol--glycerol-3-phosphate 3-phosphatidyltransferase [Bombilactobacillus mellifer]MCT6826732.1 CDP-diacylglycerol--glycerol-3-phosphate 3-phosphatidyltransferase [Bombilactobacillus mellifer]MCT6843810.1 CDP-diacylglycerol--glycerol-3-phosphate 3-phosphatidyltransferase [Bombilactobacillus mellifer]MCT6894802.1 CDP-diacylglycerol--glycerol-3-phosphate 3-phosphatidyltransferase [Bombilactobacillus mellifer]
MNLPNKLTVIRVFLIPIFMIFMSINFQLGSVNFFGATIRWEYLIAAVIFVGASLTDLADGKIARKRHLVTNFGKFMDPLADKMLVLTAFIYLVAVGKAPAWVVAIIACRELLITTLRLLIVEQGGSVMAAQMPGKIKTATQMLAIVFLLLNDPLFSYWQIPFGTIMLYICLIFTVYSAYDYLKQNQKYYSDFQ